MDNQSKNPRDSEYHKFRRTERKKKNAEQKDYIEARKEFYKATGIVFVKPDGWFEKAQQKIQEAGLNGNANQCIDENGNTIYHKLRNKLKTSKQKQYKKTYFKGSYDELWGNIDNLNTDNLPNI